MSRAASFRTRALSFLLMLGVAAPSIVAAQGVEEPRIPLRTALMELNTLRTEYAEAFNRKDMAGLASVYASDAVLIDVDGARYDGIDAIREYMNGRTQGHMVLTADSASTRVFGNTAFEVGTVTVHPEGGGENVAHYLSVFRRGMTGWKLVSVALVPKAE